MMKISNVQRRFKNCSEHSYTCLDSTFRCTGFIVYNYLIICLLGHSQMDQSTFFLMILKAHSVYRDTVSLNFQQENHQLDFNIYDFFIYFKNIYNFLNIEGYFYPVKWTNLKGTISLTNAARWNLSSSPHPLTSWCLTLLMGSQPLRHPAETVLMELKSTISDLRLGLKLGGALSFCAVSSTLAWKIPWTEEPGGLQSMGSHRVGHDWSDLAAAAPAMSLDLQT